MSEEQWLPFATWPGYEVSSLARVRSLTRRVRHAYGGTRLLEGRVLRPHRDRRGYLQVDLYRDGRRKTHYLHVLVLEVFVGPRPGGLEGCHNDGDKLNNLPSNLRWDTYEANREDMVRHGRGPRKTSHCPLGHLKSGYNAYRGSTRRGVICRSCMNALGCKAVKSLSGEARQAEFRR